MGRRGTRTAHPTASKRLKMQFTAEMEQQKQENNMAEALGKPTLRVVQSELQNKKKKRKFPVYY